MDKAARAALLTAKRKDNASENIADYVADLLRQGRSSEVTNDLMEQADPQRLMHHYTTGNTGMELPMNQASRMARAREMYEGAAKRARDEEFSSAVGLRTDTKPDGWTRPSRVWKEGVPTKKRLNGVATTQLSANKNNDEAFSQHGLGEKPPIGGGYAFDPKRKFLSLIHGDTSETGADDLESIIPDARSMLTRDRTTARFDPRLSHLSHLSASTGGAMELARAVVAKSRAGGQIAPSKYLPNVPRAVHAGGGKVAGSYPFMQHLQQASDDMGHGFGFEEGGCLGMAHALAEEIGGRIAASKSGFKHYYAEKNGNLYDYTGKTQDKSGHTITSLPEAMRDLGLSAQEHEADKASAKEVIEEANSRAQGRATGGRAVHAGGGKVAFMQGNHPDVPDVLYHGSVPKIAYKGFTSDIDREQTQKNLEAQNFREFKPSSHGSYGSGIYLSDSPKVASDFAQSIRSDQKEPQPFGQVLKLHVSMKQPFTDDTLRHPEWKAYIKRALTRMSLPKQYEDDIAHRDAFLKALNKGNATVRDLFLREGQHGTMVNQFGQDDIHNTIRNSGFDGIIAHRPDGSKEYVAFHPNQIKSAIGNQGTFDPSDPDITKAGGGDVEGEEDGITAYHGSPHSFDQFDIGKLGTGEGNQAYGHGLYFGGTEDVARHYRESLSNGYSIDGKQYNATTTKVGATTPGHHAADALDRFKGDKKFAIDWLTGGGPTDKEAAKLLKRAKVIEPWSGHMYKVKLNVKPEELLDWDKPMSEQPHILNAIGNRYGDPEIVMQQLGHDVNTATGRDLHDALSGMGQDKQLAAKNLQDMGLKGIRYRDAGSRDMSDGDPTHNYVMFHHEPVQVTDKYEYGGMVGKDYGGAMGYVPQSFAQQQEVAMVQPLRQAQRQKTSTIDTIAQLNELSKMGGTKPTAIAPSPSAASEGHPPTAGVSDAARAAFDALNKGWTGAPISVESAYRDPALNEAVGGAKGSQHLHGNAYDIDTSGWTPEAKLALATQAYNSGFRGFGFYDNNLHFDVGGQRAWGPSYHQDSIPDWAQDWTQQYVYANGGRVHANGGGKMELRSKAAQVVRSQPQEKGNVDQMLAMMVAKGVKPSELLNAGRPFGHSVSKEELAQHFEEAVPKVQITKYGAKPLSNDEKKEFHDLGLKREKGNLFGNEARRFFDLNDKAEGNTQYSEYSLPGGENYREHVLHLPKGNGETFHSDHWMDPNVLAHVRMKDRDNGKTLHVEEVQSDWGQEGRKKGFYDPMKPIKVFHSGTGKTVHATDDMGEAKATAERLGPEYDYARQDEDKVPQGPYVGNTQQWTDLAIKHALTEAAKGGHNRVVFSPGEANADLSGQRTPITNARLVWGSPETGYLYTRKKDAKYDSDAIQFQGEKHLNSLLGKQHAKALLAQDGLESSISEPDMHLGGHGMVDYYNNIVHPAALKLLRQHDPSIQPESYDLPNGYKGYSLPMTDKARQSILDNGFQAFKDGGTVGKEEGGAVDAALALTRRFTKDGTGATLALKSKGK